MRALSKMPLLIPHSGSRDVFDHPRNLDDARIRKLAVAGGAICVTTVYLSDMNLTPEREKLFARLERIGELSPAEQADLTARWRALDASASMWADDFERFMVALLHLVEVAGVEHVFLGADSIGREWCRDRVLQDG